MKMDGDWRRVALVSDLDQSRLHDAEFGVGSAHQAVKVFDQISDAVAFAAHMVSENTDIVGTSESAILKEFQDSLGSLEWFHIFPVDGGQP